MSFLYGDIYYEATTLFQTAFGIFYYESIRSPEVAVMFENKIVHSNAQKIFVDLKKENAVQLEEKGVIPDHIEISKHCTICEKELFHSFRREGKSAGRMMAVIYLKP
jgi:copper oxidase (laccase) domain-containing protein